MIWKYLWFLLMAKSPVLLKLLWLVASIHCWNGKFQLERLVKMNISFFFLSKITSDSWSRTLLKSAISISSVYTWNTHTHKYTHKHTPTHTHTHPPSNACPEISVLESDSILMTPIKDTSHMSLASVVAQLVKNLPTIQETPVQSPGQEDPLEKGYTTHSSILGLPWWLRQ